MNKRFQNLTNPAKIREVLKKRKLIWMVILGVLAIHVLTVVIFGSFVMFRHLFKNEVTFETVPEYEKRIDPRKLEHKVKVQKQQQKSGRPKVLSRIQANRISEFALPKINVDPEKIKNPVKSNLPSLGRDGLGSGVMGGKGSGGLGIGMSEVSFMGVKTKVERVAIIIDLSESMIVDERGGAAGFDALKSEIKDVINSLNGSSFFTLITFKSEYFTFNSPAVLATKENQKKACEWIDMVEIVDRYANYWGQAVTTGGVGMKGGKNEYSLDKNGPKIEVEGGTSRHDLALASAMESNVDTIFLISDGDPRIWHPLTEEQKKRLDELNAKRRADPKYAEKRAEYEAKRQKFFAARRALNERRAKKGLPPKVTEGIGAPGGPGGVGRTYYSNEEILNYVDELVKFYYTDQDKRKPRIYTLGYVTNRASEHFMRKLASENRGRFRRIPPLVKPIRFE